VTVAPAPRGAPTGTPWAWSKHASCGGSRCEPGHLAPSAGHRVGDSRPTASGGRLTGSEVDQGLCTG
jgi:hypothetical protein